MILKLHIFILALVLSDLSVVSAQEHVDLIDFLFTWTERVTLDSLHSCSQAQLAFLEENLGAFPKPQAPWDVGAAIRQHSNELRMFDFSGDGIPDLIYSGYFGAEERHNLFWIRTSSGFSFAGEIPGFGVKLLRGSSAGSYDVVAHWNFPSDGGSFGNLTSWKLSSHSGLMKFKINLDVQENRDLYRPRSTQAWRAIRLISDSCPLRLSPIESDSLDSEQSTFYDKPVYGNILAKLNRGSVGTEISREVDPRGRVWLLVLMDSRSKTSYSLFDPHNTGKLLGWIESHFVALLK